MDLNEVLSLAQDAGWTADRTGKGHLQLKGPHGRGLVTAPSTPSDHRSVDNLISHLRREGLDVKAFKDAQERHRRELARVAPEPVAEPSPQTPDDAAKVPTALQRRAHLTETRELMATKTVNVETSAEKISRLEREAAEQAAKFAAQIQEAKDAAAREDAKANVASLAKDLAADKPGSDEDWAAVLGLAPDSALKAAGFLLRAPRGSNVPASSGAGSRSPRLSLDEVTAALPAKSPWTIADLAASIKREPATARNYLPKLIEAGIIVEAGVDESFKGPRKPKLYAKA